MTTARSLVNHKGWDSQYAKPKITQTQNNGETERGREEAERKDCAIAAYYTDPIILRIFGIALFLNTFEMSLHSF